jgi:uncharacterized membrane protein YphA (DoxX/SURF4 family)
MITRPIAIIGALSVMIITFTSLIVSGFMKINGYPDDSRPWPLACILMRHYAFVLMIIPVIWVGITTYVCANEEKYAKLYKYLIYIGTIFLILLTLYCIVAIGVSMSPRRIIGTGF